MLQMIISFTVQDYTVYNKRGADFFFISDPKVCRREQYCNVKLYTILTTEPEVDLKGRETTVAFNINPSCMSMF